MIRTALQVIINLMLAMLCLSQCRPKQEPPPPPLSGGKFSVPASIQQVHDQLLQEIHALASLPDSTGSAAMKLEELMIHHFKEEEAFVLPALGLLPASGSGNMPEGTAELLARSAMVDSLIHHLEPEHQLIKAFLDELTNVAEREGHPEAGQFALKVRQHALLEEEVLFPAVLLLETHYRKSAK